MKAKRWTLGVVLAAAVSLWGLIEADASPFSSQVLSDDLSNQVNGVAPDGSSFDGSSSGSSADSGSGSSTATTTKDNNGNGNNVDGVDSSNPGQGGNKVDSSCPEGGTCIDDEMTKASTK